MSEKRNIGWNDVVNEVERAGVEEQNQVRQDLRAINRQYVDVLEAEMGRHREELRRRELQKLREREVIEQQSQAEKQQLIMKKLNQKNKELQYQEVNNKLIQNMMTKNVSKPIP